MRLACKPIQNFGNGKLKGEINGTLHEECFGNASLARRDYTEQVGKHTFPNLYIRWKHVASTTYSEGRGARPLRNNTPGLSR